MRSIIILRKIKYIYIYIHIIFFIINVKIIVENISKEFKKLLLYYYMKIRKTLISLYFFFSLK